MKIVGYTALRYGADYLGYAIRSIINHIDEYHVLYATKPSHGHPSDLPCPDTEEELHEIAWQAAGTKLHWHRGDWVYEGQQRDSILQYAPDADMIISCDSDEIFSETLINNIVNSSPDYVSIVPTRYARLPFIHYWRSFNKCVLHDPAYPARVTYPKVASGEVTWPIQYGVVNHMGYATTPAIMAYKWQIHGHKDELRHDMNWYQDVFMANRQTDTHPVGSEYWNTETVNPLHYMPYWMVDHPFYGMDVIR